MFRCPVVLAIACTLAANGCSSSTAPPPTARPSAVTGLTTARSGRPVPTAPGGGEVPLPGSAPPIAASSTSTSPPDNPAEAARRAFDSWLHARIKADPATMLANSVGAAAALGVVQLVGDEIVRSRGSSISTQITREVLHPARVTNTQVTFTGEVDLRETVSGPRGKLILHHRFTGPVEVVRKAGTWKVRSLTYDNASLAYYPQGLRKTVSGVRLSVAFVLSYSSHTSVLISLRSASRTQGVDLQKVILTSATGAFHSGRAVFSSGVAAILLDFPRFADSPARLDITLRKRPNTSVHFSLALHSRQY